MVPSHRELGFAEVAALFPRDWIFGEFLLAALRAFGTKLWPGGTPANPATLVRKRDDRYSCGEGQDGTSCERPADRIVSLLVRSSNPITSRTAAEARSIALRWLLTTRTSGRALSKANASTMNGRPSPRQEAIIKTRTCAVVPAETAELRTALRVTPMQGVHPLAKPIPSTKPPVTPPPVGARFIT